MWVVTLDVKGTHVNNPDCPMRLAPLPDGRGWYCVDCGCEILHKRVEVEERHILETPIRGRPPIKPSWVTWEICPRCDKPKAECECPVPDGLEGNRG